MSSENMSDVTDTIAGTRDALTIRKVFGDAYEVDGVQIIPVAKVAGGAGGGAGESDDDEGGSGYGSGFGMSARGIGVYEVRDGHAVWKPAIDVNKVIRGGQVLGAIVIVCVTLIAIARR